MFTSMKAAPPNALVLVMDVMGGDIPATMRDKVIVSTKSCIAVGCRADVDGDTEFILGNAGDVNPGGCPAFAGHLEIPSRNIVVRTIHGVVLLGMPVPRQQTTIQIWVNDPWEPDKIIVGVS